MAQLAEESCFAADENDKQAVTNNNNNNNNKTLKCLTINLTCELIKAMEKAKEAYRKERLILKQREEKGLAEQANTELTGFV